MGVTEALSARKGPAKGHVVNLDPLLDAYYEFIGGDRNGKPTQKKLKEIGLDESF